MSRQTIPKLAAWLVLALILASSAFALGIAPGHTDITFEPNVEHTVKLKILNQEKQAMQVILYAEGELAQYVSFAQPMVQFSKGEEENYATYTIKLPASFERHGQYTTNIVARAIPTAGSSGSVGMTATVALISKLNVMVPYSGKYAEITLYSPNFEQGRDGNFAVEVKNLGTEDILNGQMVIDIYGPTNTKLLTLTGESFRLDSKQSKIVTINWKPELNLGSYKAVATLIYDGKNAKAEQLFNLGQLALSIVDISVKDFKLGGIAMFNIMLENNWNEPIPGAYGIVSVKDQAGKSYTEFKTASVDINEGEKQPIQAYWDTKSVGPGNYKLNVVLNYLGKTTEKVFDILVSVDRIDTNLGAMAVTESGKKIEPILQGIYILTFLVVVLIIFNVIMFIRKSKKEK